MAYRVMTKHGRKFYSVIEGDLGSKARIFKTEKEAKYYASQLKGTKKIVQVKKRKPSYGGMFGRLPF